MGKETILKFASIFAKQAQIPLGQSTLSTEQAINIGKIAKEAFDQIDKALLNAYSHDNFKLVINQLSNGSIPEKQYITAAIQEFEAGLKNIEPFNKIRNSFKNLQYIG